MNRCFTFSGRFEIVLARLFKKKPFLEHKRVLFVIKFIAKKNLFSEDPAKIIVDLIIY